MLCQINLLWHDPIVVKIYKHKEKRQGSFEGYHPQCIERLSGYSFKLNWVTDYGLILGRLFALKFPSLYLLSLYQKFSFFPHLSASSIFKQVIPVLYNDLYA